jgi:hypothetical protein
MHRSSLVWTCGLLLTVAACGSSSTDSDPGSDREVNSQEDVQQLFQAVMPDLVAALTALANSSPATLSSSTDKGGGSSSTVDCPGGGTLTVDVDTGRASLTNCSAGGVIISADLELSVTFTGFLYEARFSGTLMVSGSFTGTVEVVMAFIQWSDPPNDATTYWEVTVLLGGRNVTVTSDDSGNVPTECGPYDDPDGGPGSVPRDGLCDEDSDCESNSCRLDNPDATERCTCRPSRGPECDSCIGVDAGAPDDTPNPAVTCEAADEFSCSCETQNGETHLFYPSAEECYS